MRRSGVELRLGGGDFRFTEGDLGDLEGDFRLRGDLFGEITGLFFLSGDGDAVTSLPTLRYMQAPGLGSVGVVAAFVHPLVWVG